MNRRIKNIDVEKMMSLVEDIFSRVKHEAMTAKEGMEEVEGEVLTLIDKMVSCPGTEGGKKTTKSLIKTMSYAEAERYCLNHKSYHIPSPEEAEKINPEDIEHTIFWVDERIGDRRAVYNKENHSYHRIHPNFLQNVVLVRNSDHISCDTLETNKKGAVWA